MPFFEVLIIIDLKLLFPFEDHLRSDLPALQFCIFELELENAQNFELFHRQLEVSFLLGGSLVYIRFYFPSLPSPSTQAPQQLREKNPNFLGTPLILNCMENQLWPRYPLTSGLSDRSEDGCVWSM